MRMLLILATCLMFALHGFAQEAEYIVGLKQDMPRRGKVRREFPNLKAYHTRITHADADELRKDKRVKYVEVNRELKLGDVQSNAVWNLARIDQRGPIGSPPDSDYNYTATGDGVIVYVIDTGVWLDHPEFEGRATAGMGIDHSDMAICANGHGTHVAGIIASKTYGVAKKAKIVSLRLGTCANPTLTVSDLIWSLDWIAAQKISKSETRVTNISLILYGWSPAIDDAIDVVRSKKVVVVVAAGNDAADACNYSPARHPPAITVGAMWSEDARALWSNFGICIDLFAPGDSITSTWNSPATLTNSMSGTSMASPHVAGIAALYLQNHRRASPSEVELAIIANATTGALANVGLGSPNLLAYSLW